MCQLVQEHTHSVSSLGFREVRKSLPKEATSELSLEEPLRVAKWKRSEVGRGKVDASRQREKHM